MRNTTILALAAFVLLPLLLGAETPATVPGLRVFQVTDQSSTRAYDYAQAPDVIAPGQTVTMVVKDADVAAILGLLAKQFNLNLLTTSDVKATVSFQFTDVPVNTVLTVLTKAAGCNFIRSGDVLVIKPLKSDMEGDLATKVYDFDYLEATDVKTAVDKMLSGKGKSEVSYRRVGDGGSSKRSSVLIVTDYPDDLTRIDAMIQQLDQPVPEIAIEAKFIETTLSSSDLYGINWNIEAGVNGVVPPNPTVTPAPGSPIKGPVYFGGLMLGTLDLGRLSAILSLMQTRGDAKLLANPRTITEDNQTATMSISTKVPVREVRIDPGTQAQTITWTTQTIPISLTVTPHVLSDGAISMEVEPVEEAITGYVGPPDDEKPITSRREAKTQIEMRDGEVAVIGGLVKDEVTKSVNKVPVLGHIPVLGPLLFTSTSIQTTKNDLLIFIIPHVLPAQ